MSAKMKCPNCGNEMLNLNMSWGWKHYLIMLPIIALTFLPFVKMSFFRGDVTKELTISDVQKRRSEGRLEIVGIITI